MQPLASFFTAYRTHGPCSAASFSPIEIPVRCPAFVRFYKVAKRRLDDISTVAAAMAIDRDARRSRVRARAVRVFGGVAATPLASWEAGAGRRRPALERGCRRACAAGLERVLEPMTDHRGSKEYRREVSKSLVEKILVGASRHDDRRSSPVPHESARGHVTGDALVYRRPRRDGFPRLLHAWPVTAPHAHALVTSLDARRHFDEPGVVTVLTAADVPGEGDTGPARHDEPLFPTEVMFHRQPVAWVLGETARGAQTRRRARACRSTSRCPPILTIEQAIEARKLPDRAVAPAQRRHVGASSRARAAIDGELAIGGQEHFYSRDAGRHRLDRRERRRRRCTRRRSTRPETQDDRARACSASRGIRSTVECLRMGGAFGGKEVQANAVGRDRRARRVEDPAPGPRAADARARHGADRQAPSVPGALRRRISTPTADSGAQLAALFRRRLEPRSLRADHVALALSLRQRLSLCRPSRPSGACAARTRRRRRRSADSADRRRWSAIEDILSQAAQRLSLPADVDPRAQLLSRRATRPTTAQPVCEADRIQTIWHQLKETSAFDARPRRGRGVQRAA